MSIASRLAGWWRVRSTSNASSPDQWFIDWVHGGRESATGIVVSQLRAMQDTTCMACVSIRASDLAKCPVHVYRRQPDGGNVIWRSHPLEALLREPNDWQSRLEFIEQMQAALLLRGNAYAGILRDNRARPINLIPFWPDRVTLYAGSDGDLYYEVSSATNQHEMAWLARFPKRIPAADMLHLRWLSFSGLAGLSRLNLARDAIGLSLALEEHSSRLFANGARPGGVLETDKRLSDPVFKRFQAQWREYSGVGNSGKTPILEEGLKWKAQMMTSVEAETIAARRLQIEQIATTFDVPIHRLSTLMGGTPPAGPAILQANQMYLNNTLSTDAERWEAKLDKTFGLDGEETFVAFDLDYFNRADVQTRMNTYRTGVVGMIMTPNEARRREGYPAHPEGDTLYQPTNVAPIGFDPSGKETGPGSDVTGAPAPGGDGDPAAVPPVE